MSATERNPAFRLLTAVLAGATVLALPGTASATPDDVPPDRYRIVSALTGQCLALGAGVVELANCGGDATTWDVVPVPKAVPEPAPAPAAPMSGLRPFALAADGAMQIRHLVDCVTNDGGLKVAACGVKTQEWLFHVTDTGDFTIASGVDNTVLVVVPAADETAGDTVHTANPTDDRGEVWLLQPVE